MRAALLAALVCAGIAGCFNPDLNEGVACGPGDTCPSDQMCAADGKCYSEGNGPPDASVADASMSVDAPPPGIDARVIDAGPGAPDAYLGPCNPVANTGCDSGYKCTQADYGAGPMTRCAPDGTIGVGAACSSNGMYDDCVGGAFCVGGVCTQICSTTPDSCAMGSACTVYSGVFADQTNTGVCVDDCDAITQDCTVPGDACFLSIASGQTTCASVQFPSNTQGDACMFINGCAEGFGCVLNNDPVMPTGLECAQFCATAASTCSAGFNCCEIRSFYADAPDVPAGLGMCVGVTEWGTTCPTNQ